MFPLLRSWKNNYKALAMKCLNVPKEQDDLRIFRSWNDYVISRLYMFCSKYVILIVINENTRVS